MVGVHRSGRVWELRAVEVVVEVWAGAKAAAEPMRVARMADFMVLCCFYCSIVKRNVLCWCGRRVRYT